MGTSLFDLVIKRCLFTAEYAEAAEKIQVLSEGFLRGLRDLRGENRFFRKSF
jgi:hypothetical protein